MINAETLATVHTHTHTCKLNGLNSSLKKALLIVQKMRDR